MLMRLPPPDGSRDARIEDPTNRWVIHLAGRMLLPLALRLGISANAISIVGFLSGVGAFWCFLRWDEPAMATLAFLLCIGWMIADGLDGMVARATRTASPLGRFLDGVCDHGVFLLLYLSMGFALNTPFVWVFGTFAGLVHTVQASLYEGERMRFHRRVKGDPLPPRVRPPNALVRAYDSIAGSLDRLAEPFDRLLARSPDPRRLGEIYGDAATPPMRLMALLTNNVRVIAMYLACLAGDPTLFWWFELLPLSAVTAIGILWHRRVEARLIGRSV